MQRRNLLSVLIALALATVASFYAMCSLMLRLPSAFLLSFMQHELSSGCWHEEHAFPLGHLVWVQLR